MAQRSMDLQVNIQDGEVTVTNNETITTLTPVRKLPSDA